MARAHRIAILTPSKDSYSETFIANHIRHLPYEITVIYGGYFPWLCDEEVDSSKSQAFWNLYDIARRKRGGVSTYRRKRLIQLLKDREVELVLAEYVVTGSQVWGVCQELGIPLIATGLGYDVSVRSVMEKYAADYRGYATYAANTVVVAQNMKETMQAFGAPPERITWSPAGPADDFFELHSSPSRSSTFLSLGRFVEKKAPHLSLLAFAKIAERYPEARLIMGGDGPLMQVCIDISKASGIEGRIDFIGRIDQEEQKRLLSDCLAFVQHSRTASDGDMEGTPVAILEASAAGLPIISTRHSGIPDIVKEGVSGLLVDEGDVDAMASAMARLLSDKGAAELMGTKGRRLVKEHFTLEAHIRTLTEVIDQAIGRS